MSESPSSALADYLERQNEVLLSLVSQVGMIVQANTATLKDLRAGTPMTDAARSGDPR